MTRELDPRKRFFMLYGVSNRRPAPHRIDLGLELPDVSLDEETLAELARSHAEEFGGGVYYILEARPVRVVTRNTNRRLRNA